MTTVKFSLFIEVIYECLKDRKMAENTINNEVNEDGKQKIDDEKQIIDDEKQITDDKKQMIDDGNQIIDDENQMIDDEKKVIDDENQLIDDENQIIDDEKQITDDKKQIIDGGDQIIDDEEQMLDDEKKVIDDENQMIDEEIAIIDYRVSETVDEEKTTTIDDDETETNYDDDQSSEDDDEEEDEVECDMSFAQTSTLATLLPDEILNYARVHGKERRRFECAMLLADISGFTALCEKYTLTGKGGTYQMTKTLNAYIGKMVQQIIVNGGDVLKFSGDAFLASWKVEDDEKMAPTIAKIVRCALFIQNSLGEYQTDVKVNLRVKLAISAGTATFSVIGDEDMRHYIIVGEPISEIRLAEYMCVSGDVLLSPSAWKFCDGTQYISAHIGDHGHVKIIEEVGAVDPVDPKPPPKPSGDSGGEDALSDWEAVRVTVVRMAESKGGAYLRPFIIPPVLQQVDHEQPLEYLTEMRQVVTMFVNVITSEAPVDEFISLVDEAYCNICSNTEVASGCVNKVSLFDKDLMFLVVFGLRGSSHDMEIKNSLVCAATCHQQLSTIEGVKAVSIGVTTGLAYCGVVGHPMRREYTVLGSTVNKAARIMVAYPGKITCDRNTFLHSKLASVSFHLQEPKELKGLSSVGPIYEFSYVEKRVSSGADVAPWPLLGRDTAINLYISKLVSLQIHRKKREQRIKHKVLHSGIAFYGEPRIGKTRLLEDLANLTRVQELPCLLTYLTSSHRRAPYAAAAYLFQLIIGIDELASPKEKEEILSSYFGLELKPKELCYLNDIFQIKFDLTEEYISKSEDDRMVNRAKVAKKLLNLCCVAVAPIVVIALDDVHHMDPPSAILFSSFLDCDNILFVVSLSVDIPTELSDIETIGTEGSHFLHIGESQAALSKFCNHPRLFQYPLTGLALEFMAPLACQLLDVRGIPSELETVLQNQSQGNPGWVESYLVSLLQTGSLYLTNMDPTNPQHGTLVFPEEAMVSRQGHDYIKKFKIPDDDPDFADQFLNLECLLEEKMKNEYSYKENLQITLGKTDPVMMASLADRLVCMLMPDFHIDESSVPNSMNGVIMTAFDSLDPFCHFLVKAASVLGNKFMRMMLIHVMQYPSPKKVAEAVRDVFDARIISCAKSENQSKNLSTLKSRCSCNEGAKIHYGSHLPRYAFCNLLQFRTPLYRETAYELLPEDQKKDLHNRAVDFLENEAHRCEACGHHPFFKVPAFNAPLSDWLSAFEGELDPSKGEETETEIQDEENKLKSDSNESVKRCESSASMGICLSVVDLTQCECHLILATVYIHMIEHARAAENKEKLLSFLIEFGAAAVPLGLSTQAVKFLEEAEKLLHQLGGKKKTHVEGEDMEEDETWFARGIIKLLQGQALYDLGQYDNSLEVLMPALTIFKITIPDFQEQKKTKGAPILLEVKHYLYRFLPCLQSITVSTGSKPLCSAAAECLSLICQIKMAEDDLLLAEFAAIKGLDMAEQTRNNFLALCRAYSDNIEFSMKNGNLRRCHEVERMSLTLCRKMSRKVTTDRALLLAIYRLYYVTFNSRLLRGDLDAAIRIGHHSLKLSEKMFQSASTKVLILPLLVQSLLIKGRLHETVDLLTELLRIAEDNADISAITWYHSLCLDLIMDTGFALEKYSACKAYADERMGAISDSDMSSHAADRRLIISLWLWCIRCERWEEATSWEDATNFSLGINSVTSAISTLGLALSNQKNPEEEEKFRFVLSAFPNLIAGLKYLEGLELMLVGKLNIKAYSTIPELHQQIIHVIKAIKKCTKFAKIAKPRLLHLQAYYNIIRGRTAIAMNMLRRALHLCEKCGNKLEASWIDHNKRVWLGVSSNIVKDFWRHHCNGQTVDWHEADIVETSTLLFSLPVPRNLL